MVDSTLVRGYFNVHDFLLHVLSNRPEQSIALPSSGSVVSGERIKSPVFCTCNIKTKYYGRWYLITITNNSEDRHPE